MPCSSDRLRKVAGTCDPVLAKIRNLRMLLTEAEEALARAEDATRPILEVGISALQKELRSSSRRLRLAS